MWLMTIMVAGAHADAVEHPRVEATEMDYIGKRRLICQGAGDLAGFLEKGASAVGGNGSVFGVARFRLAATMTMGLAFAGFHVPGS